MAVSGSGGWIPSTRVRIRNAELISAEYTQNVPREIVETDINAAAAQLRAHPADLLRVDAKTIYKLKELLLASGHIAKV